MSKAWDDVTGRLTGAETDRLLAVLPSDEAKFVSGHFPVWAHSGQTIDPADPRAETWRTWVIMAGRGFGKTLAGAQWVTGQIATKEPLAIALVGATIEDARRVMVEGRSGLMNVAAEWIAAWHPSLNQLHFTTGATATLFSRASPDRLRGPEHHLAWCDELAKWERAADTWDMLQLGLRLGDRPRALITTTPRGGPLLRVILAEPDTVQTGGATADNPHTAAAFKARVHDLYAGTRLGAQELEGRLLTDTPGALWTVDLLERCRKNEPPPTPPRNRGGESQPDSPPAFAGGAGGGTYFFPRQTPFTRICIGVDPPSGDGTCGIIACALDEAGAAHVLADHSVTARTPEGWARAVADAARIHATSQPSLLTGEGRLAAGERGEGANERHREAPPEIPVMVVAETNQGGRMVKTILHTADPNLNVKPVTARHSKTHRAEPVAHLFEAGKVRLHGYFPALEAQLLGLIAGGGYEGPGDSPDRADAMVWALTELMLTRKGAPQVRGFGDRTDAFFPA